MALSMHLEYHSTDGCQTVRGTWVIISPTIITMELNVSRKLNRSLIRRINVLI